MDVLRLSPRRMALKGSRSGRRKGRRGGVEAAWKGGGEQAVAVVVEEDVQGWVKSARCKSKCARSWKAAVGCCIPAVGKRGAG